MGQIQWVEGNWEKENRGKIKTISWRKGEIRVGFRKRKGRKGKIGSYWETEENWEWYY